MEYFREREKKRFWQNSFSAASLLIFFILWGKLLTIQSGMTKFEKKAILWQYLEWKNYAFCPTVRRKGFVPGSIPDLEGARLFWWFLWTTPVTNDERSDTRSAVGLAELLIFCNLILITNTHSHRHTLICIYSLIKMNEKINTDTNSK